MEGSPGKKKSLSKAKYFLPLNSFRNRLRGHGDLGVLWLSFRRGRNVLNGTLLGLAGECVLPPSHQSPTLLIVWALTSPGCCSSTRKFSAESSQRIIWELGCGLLPWRAVGLRDPKTEHTSLTARQRTRHYFHY